MTLKKYLRKRYPHVATSGETPEQTAIRILEEYQNYYVLTLPEIFEFCNKLLSYSNPNSGVPDSQKTLSTEYYVKCITEGLILNGKKKLPGEINI